MGKNEREQLLFAAVVDLIRGIFSSEPMLCIYSACKFEMATSMPVSTTFFNEGYFAIIAATFSGEGSILNDCACQNS